MGKIVKGYWDCSACGTTGISGSERNCPGCGKPRGDDVEFYMKDVEYLSEEEAAKVSKEADWYCSFCDSLNPASATECQSCGASKADSEKNYFDLKHERQEKAAAKQQKIDEKELSAKKAGRKKMFLAIAGALVIIVAAIGILTMPKTSEAAVTGFAWERNIDIEQWQNIEENDWTLPAEATLLTKKQEVHHYDHVLDHYETVEVERSREVLDGYDTQVDYVDMGNGNFEEVETQIPRYRTEYYTEYEEQPVYVDEPVYKTKYYYTIWKWVPVRTTTTAGSDHEPYWGETNLAKDEQEGERYGNYDLIVEGDKIGECTFRVNEDYWNERSVGDSVSVKKHTGGTYELLDDSGNAIAKSEK